jgi:hypothetical protein
VAECAGAGLVSVPVLVMVLANPRLPIIGIAACCARATTGHAAALPSPAMNSRRRIRDLPCWIREPIAVRVVWEIAETRMAALADRVYISILLQ